MKKLYRWQVVCVEAKPSPENDDVWGDVAVEPPEGYELVDWKVDRRGDIFVCWRLTVYEQQKR